MSGKRLGHNHVYTTARYAHLAKDSVNSSANRIAIAEVTRLVVVAMVLQTQCVSRFFEIRISSARFRSRCG